MRSKAFSFLWCSRLAWDALCIFGYQEYPKKFMTLLPLIFINGKFWFSFSLSTKKILCKRQIYEKRGCTKHLFPVKVYQLHNLDESILTEITFFFLEKKQRSKEKKKMARHFHLESDIFFIQQQGKEEGVHSQNKLSLSLSLWLEKGSIDWNYIIFVPYLNMENGGVLDLARVSGKNLSWVV